MEPRHLLGQAAFGPAVLKALFRAFDEAWLVIGPRYGNDLAAVDAARLKLANTLLSLAGTNTRDGDKLREAALKLYDTKS